VSAENWHLTLRFIGEWPDERRGEVVSSLRNVRSAGPIQLVVESLGVLPNLRSPRVLWAGVRHEEDLPKLAASVDQALAVLGEERERRAFKPHITLGRVKKKIRQADLERAINDGQKEFGTVRADRFVLFESELRPGGAVYRKVEEFVFAAGRS
jgi:2'-5' RNA ligase